MVVSEFRPSLNFSDCSAVSLAFPVLMVLYISFLMIFALYYGYKVRNIGPQYEKYSHAKFIAMLVFIVSIFTCIVAPMQFYISEL
jgi:hypothetical protein